MSFVVPLIPGDGIGPEIISSLKKIFRAAGVPLEWKELKAGQSALDAGLELWPAETLQSVRQHGYLVKGPLQDLEKNTAQQFQLYAQVQSFKTTPGVSSRYGGVNLVLISEIPLPGLPLKENYERLLRLAFEYARQHQRKKITLLHHRSGDEQSNAFLRAGLSLSQAYPDILMQDMEMEKAGMALVERPERFDILVASGSFSGIFTHLGMALTGGIALSASSIVGKEISIFEPVHGTAKDIAGMGIANPVAMIRAGLLLLDHLGLQAEASNIRVAMENVLADSGSGTVDIGGSSDTEMFTQKVIDLVSGIK